MKTPRFKITAVAGATALLLALPGAAAAEDYFVPEGNSAVTQYSETFPTAGGDKGSGANQNKGLTAPKAIGAKNTAELEQHGPEGAAAAEVAAETAPAPETVQPSSTPPSSGTGQSTAKPKHHKSAKPQPDKKTQQNDEEAQSAPAPSNGGDSPSGSGGLGEVVSKALGIDSPGDLGFLLPLILIGSLAWAVLYSARHRHEPAE